MEEYIARIDHIILKPDGNYEIKISLFAKSALPRPFLPQMYTDGSDKALFASFIFELSPTDWSIQAGDELMESLELYSKNQEMENLTGEEQKKWTVGYFIDFIAEQLLESDILEIHDPWNLEDEGDEDELSLN